MTLRLPLAVVAVVVSLACHAARAAQSAPAADNRPNIVYIIADDLGYADLGAQGLSKDVKTPNIDAIAAGGVRFTSGYVSCPVCAPTRAGLMTGRYQQRFGFEFNPGPKAADTFGLPADQVTLPQALREAGYATGMVGKWHLGNRPEMHPNERGFDEFFGFLGGAHDYNKAGKGTNALMRNDEPVRLTEYLTDAFGREAAAFVDRHGGARAEAAGAGKPFFLYLAFNAVHTPQQSPKKYLERFPGVKDKKRRTMLAMLSAMDDAVGQVTAALAKHGQGGNTLIVFHTDNGGPTNGNGSLNTPLNGFKGGVREGGIRVPFLMSWPGRLPAGVEYDQPVIALDVFPTALAAAGAPTPNGVTFDGVNLLPYLSGSVTEPAPPPHLALFWRFGQQWAVRHRDFKLVHAGAKSPVQLFNVAKDPGEQNDLAAAEPDRVKELRALYDEWNALNVPPLWKDLRSEKQ